MNRALFFIAFLLTAPAFAGSKPKPTLFPMAEGNYWILKSSLGDERIILCEPGPKKLLQLTSFLEQPVTFYGSPKSPKLFRWDALRGKPRRTVRLRPFKKGASFFSLGERPCDQILLELGPVSGTLRTTVGDFANCSALAISTPGPILPGSCELLAEQIYFAPGVGPVAYQGRLGRVYLLVEAQVGDTLIGGQ